MGDNPAMTDAPDKITPPDEIADCPGLDPGIRPYVKLLREAGIETCQSCQGGKGHAYPEPTIEFHGTYADGFRALAIAQTFGLTSRRASPRVDDRVRRTRRACLDADFQVPRR